MLLFANRVLIEKEEGGERWIYEPEFLTELISTELANGCLGDVEKQISAQRSAAAHPFEIKLDCGWGSPIVPSIAGEKPLYHADLGLVSVAREM